MPSSPIRTRVRAEYLSTEEQELTQFLSTNLPHAEVLNIPAGAQVETEQHAGETISRILGPTPKYMWKDLVSTRLHVIESFIDAYFLSQAIGGFTCPPDINPTMKKIWEEGFYKNEAMERMAGNLSNAWTRTLTAAGLVARGIIAPLRVFPQGPN